MAAYPRRSRRRARRARGSDPAGDRRAAVGARRTDGRRHRRAVRDQRPGDLAPSARARRGPAWSSGASTGSGAMCGCSRPRCDRSQPGSHARAAIGIRRSTGSRLWPPAIRRRGGNRERVRRRARFASSSGSLRCRPSACSSCGPIPSCSRAGSVRTATTFRATRSMCGQAANGARPCAPAGRQAAHRERRLSRDRQAAASHLHLGLEPGRRLTRTRPR